MLTVLGEVVQRALVEVNRRTSLACDLAVDLSVTGRARDHGVLRCAGSYVVATRFRQFLETS